MPTRRTLLLVFAGLAGGTRIAQGEAFFRFSELAPGIRVHVPRPALVAKANQGDIANLGLVIGDEACAVIDTGGSPAIGEKFHAAIAAVTGKPVKYVINTHTHPDHLFGNIAFAGKDVTFVGHRNLPRAIASRQEYYLVSFRRQLGEELMAGMRFVAPTLLVEDELTLDLGNRRLVLKAWPPAHTDCDLTVYDQTTGTLFTGDLVFREHIPVLDGTILGWLKVMDGLASMKATLAVPGHGAPDDTWPAALDAQRTYFERLAADLRQDIKDGINLSRAIEAAAANERRNWALFDEYNGRNASQAYKELEWE